jgi:hypothetical protein
MTGEPEIDDDEPACGVMDNGEAATRRDPDRPRRQRDSLEGTPTGQREDDDVAPTWVLGDERKRGAVEDHAATGDQGRARQRHCSAGREDQARAHVVCEPAARDRDRGIELARDDREGAEVVEQHRRLAAGLQGRGAADRRRDQCPIRVARESMLVELATVGAKPNHDASASSHPDLVRERSDRLHVRDRDLPAAVAPKLDEGHPVGLCNDQCATVACELEPTRMDTCPHGRS